MFESKHYSDCNFIVILRVASMYKSMNYDCKGSNEMCTDLLCCCLVFLHWIWWQWWICALMTVIYWQLFSFAQTDYVPADLVCALIWSALMDMCTDLLCCCADLFKMTCLFAELMCWLVRVAALIWSLALIYANICCKFNTSTSCTNLFIIIQY